MPGFGGFGGGFRAGGIPKGSAQSGGFTGMGGMGGFLGPIAQAGSGPQGAGFNPGPMQMSPGPMNLRGGGGKSFAPPPNIGPPMGQRQLSVGAPGTGAGGTDVRGYGASNMMPAWAQKFGQQVQQNRAQKPPAPPMMKRNPRLGMF